MAEPHPDVTVTPAQARQIRWSLPYAQPPELAAKFVLFANTLLSLTCALIKLQPSPERDAALDALQDASAKVQAVFNIEEGIPQPPSWFHIAPEEGTP